MSENQKVVITLKGKPFEVPAGGTLGVLALGNIGVRAWKAAKKAQEERVKEEKGEKE